MVPVLPYPTRLHSYLRLNFFMFAAVFVYNCFAFVMFDRYKVQMESSRKSFGGRLAFCCACCGCCALPAIPKEDGDKKKGKEEPAAGNRGSAAVRDSSSSSSLEEAEGKESDVAVVDMDADAPPAAAARRGSGKPASRDSSEAATLKKLLQFFLDKEAKEQEEKDKEKKKKEFKRATACIPGALSDFAARCDFVFMLLFFSAYILGTVLVLRGPLPRVVLN